MERLNIVQGIMSTDGNYIILGAKKVYLGVNFNIKCFVLYDITTNYAN